MAPESVPIKALLFDVFGTCVDWRTTVTRALSAAATDALETSTTMDKSVREKAVQMSVQDWADFAHNWRSTYYTFTRELASNPSGAYKTVDDHHFDSLIELLTEKGLQLPGDARSSLYGDEQLRSLSMVWHCLDPWPDTTAGLGLLNKQFITCTLSNGNISLLNDMVKHANMDFTHIFSAEMFQSYKPSPKVYLGAVQKLGLRPEECCMVAAHLDDLKHAKSNGLRTLYVERKAEERFPDLRDEGFVDYWVSEDEDGFGAAAHKLATGV